MSAETKQVEFGKLAVGAKFYMSKPTDGAAAQSLSLPFTKIVSSKSENGVWSNAKNGFGLTIFVQYDKRVWTKN